jgi:hypothetical protein
MFASWDRDGAARPAADEHTVHVESGVSVCVDLDEPAACSYRNVRRQWQIL